MKAVRSVLTAWAGDGGLGGVGLAQRVEHHEVVDDALVTDGGDRNSGLAQPVRVRLALVAQGARGDLGALLLVGGVLVPEPLHGIAAQEVPFLIGEQE